MNSNAVKICLNMIVRNESKIIERMLTSVLPLIDMISIVDTGSTDNTVELIQNFGCTNNIPTVVHKEPFQNFGYNRTHSFKKAKETFPEATFLLLSDADFIWKGNFSDKQLLVHDSYYIEQKDSYLTYPNTRLIRSAIDWECRLVTHEYWVPRSPQTNPRYKDESKMKLSILLKDVYILDVNDGGCKQDKFERDERLIREALKNPLLRQDDEIRYTFYLAETLHHSYRYEEAIKWYLKRYQLGGYFQERYYSLYSIGKIYENQGWDVDTKIQEWNRNEEEDDDNDEEVEQVETENEQKDPEVDELFLSNDDILQQVQQKLENLNGLEENQKNEKLKEMEKQRDLYFTKAISYYWQAFQFDQKRAESLHKLAKLYRSRSNNNLAYQCALLGSKIPQPSHALFVEPDVYKYQFDVELSICAYYVGEKEREVGKASLRKLLDPANNIPEHIVQQAGSNLAFYL